MSRSHRLAPLLLFVAASCGGDGAPQGASGGDGGTSTTDSEGGSTPGGTAGTAMSASANDSTGTGGGGSTSEVVEGTSTTSTVDASGSSEGGLETSTGRDRGSSTGGSALCGDGIAERPEDCDGDDLAGADCLGLGMEFVGGALACGEGCTYDTRGCTTAVAYDLYFSEYLENGSRRALEVFNAGGDAVDVSACEINTYANGSLTSTDTLSLSGTVAAGDVLVACSALAINAGVDCDLVSDNHLSHTGNDAVELVCDGETLDVFGRIGQNSTWAGGTPFAHAEDADLRRRCGDGPDPDGSDVFLPGDHWTMFIETQTSDFGQYLCE